MEVGIFSQVICGVSEDLHPGFLAEPPAWSFLCALGPSLSWSLQHMSWSLSPHNPPAVCTPLSSLGTQDVLSLQIPNRRNVLLEVELPKL